MHGAHPEKPAGEGHSGMGAGMDHGAHGAMPMDEDMPPPPEDASNKDG